MKKGSVDAKSYTREQLGKGIDPFIISEELKKSGFSSEEVRAAFRAILEEKKTKPVKAGEKFPIFDRAPRDNFEQLAGAATLSYAIDILFFILLIVAAGLIIGWLVGGLLLSVVFAVLLLPVGFFYSWLYVSRFVYTLEEKCLLVRKGAIIYGYTLIPYENVQDVHVVQSFTGRVLGVWSVIIFTATATSAGSEHIFGLGKETAERFKEKLFYRIKEAKHVTD